MTLNGKIALVTGASRGIGRAIAERLARDGALVVAHYGKSRAAADETLANIEAAGGRAFLVGADLAAGPDAIAALFAQVDAGLAQHGEGKAIDILVNNAGIDRPLVLEQLGIAQFDEVFATNVRGPFLVTQAAAARMRDGGRIVNISSGLTRVTQANELAYTMSKGAIDKMTSVLAQHLGARGITVNSVAPGVTDTDMVAGWLHADPGAAQAVGQMAALGRIAQPEDIADVVSLIVSADAHWITGQWIDATGGFRL